MTDLLQEAAPEKLSQLRAAPEEIFLELDKEGQAALEDMKWIEEQSNHGAFESYRGEYTAVAHKTLVGHDKSLKQLRKNASEATGLDVNRIVTTFIAPIFYFR